MRGVCVLKRIIWPRPWRGTLGCPVLHGEKPRACAGAGIGDCAAGAAVADADVTPDRHKATPAGRPACWRLIYPAVAGRHGKWERSPRVGLKGERDCAFSSQPEMEVAR